MKVIVIGAVAAGMSAASKLKRLKPDTEIIVYEKGSDVSYGACGMPYYLSDLIKNEHDLIAKTTNDFKKAGITVKINHEVVGIDVREKTVMVEHQAKSFKTPYDKLIIATGARAIRLPIPGSDLKGIHVLNTLDDARALKKALHQKTNKHIAVVGGGYIGLEVAENLILMDKEVTIIEREKGLLGLFDSFIGETVHEELTRLGVKVKINETIKAYEGTTNANVVVTDKGKYAVDLIIEAVGIKPNTEFLWDDDIKMAKNGAILVNRKMETSQKDIYAAGDCVAYPHRLKKDHAYVPLGTHANKAGRVIAEQIAGNKKQLFTHVIGSSVLKVGELEIAKTGLGEEEAKHEKLPYKYVMIEARDKAGYYPNATPIKIKMLYHEETCSLLGAQMVGKQGVAHRINTVAVALYRDMSAEAFSKLDFAYAPPFAPVYDPLQVAAMQIHCQKKEREA